MSGRGLVALACARYHSLQLVGSIFTRLALASVLAASEEVIGDLLTGFDLLQSLRLLFLADCSSFSGVLILRLDWGGFAMMKWISWIFHLYFAEMVG